MNAKNIAPAFAMLWLASACQKPYEPVPLENNTLLSAVQVYGENVGSDTANYRLNYDAGQRYTGCVLNLNASPVSYYTRNITDYGGPWQTQRLAVNNGSLYEETDSSRMNAQFNPMERARAFIASDGGSGSNQTIGRQSLQYTYDSAGHYRTIRIRGWADRRSESSLGKEHVINRDSSDGQILVANNLLQTTRVDATAWSWDSSALGQTTMQSWSTHTKQFFYPEKTAAPPIHRNAYAHQAFYPLEPYFFNGGIRMANLPDRVETTVERKDAQGRVLQTEVRTENFRYEFYPSGFIKTIRVSSGGNTVVYRYIYGVD
jgi:hypothetical protein